MKRSRSFLGGVAVSSLAIGCAAQPPPPPPAPAPVVVVQPPPPPPPSRWMPVSVPPGMADRWRLITPEGLVSSDDSGGRWLFPTDGGAPRSVAVLDVDNIVSREASPDGGIVASTKDGRILFAKGALAPFELLARLPEKAEKQTFLRVDGVLTVRDERGLVTSTDGTTYRPVAPLPGFDPIEGAFDAAGHGVGLFAPETLAYTADRGATWRVVPTPGVSARSLEIHGGKATVRPGGERDGFAREVDWSTGALARVHVVNETEELTRFRQGPGGDRARPLSALGKTDPPPPPKAERFKPRGGGSAAGVSTISDGDRVVVFPSAGSRKKTWKQPVLVGKLGEGLMPFGGGDLDSCTPLAAAVCDDVLAVSCQDRIEVFRGEARVARFPMTSRSALGFDAKGRLLGITRDKQNERKLRVYDLTDPPRFDERALPADDGPSELFHGGCKRPALWHTSGKHAQRWEGDAFGAPIDQPEKTIVVGVDHQRDLILAKVVPLMVLGVGTTPVGNELHFLSAGQTVETRQAQDGGLSLAEDGLHGLLVTIDRQVLQTDDGGRTFSAIAAPQSSVGQPVFCGRDRCQLGPGAYREGFVRDASFVPTDEPPPKLLEPPPPRIKGAPPPKPKPAEALPVVMRCALDTSVLAGAPELSGSIAPRLGGSFFVGMESEADLKGLRHQTIFGDTSGKATVEPLAPVRPRARNVETPPDLMVGGGPGLIERDQSRYNDRADTSYRWSPGAALIRFKEEPRWQSPFQEVGLFGEDILGAATSGAILVWGKHKPRTVPFPRASNGVGAGVIIEGDDGSILTAFETSPTESRVVLIAPDESIREREFVARRPGGRESGIGLVAGSAPSAVSIVLVETTEDGGAELRIRPLGADLSFGAATVVPGTRAAKGELIPLAACAPGAKGALVRLMTEKRVAVRVGEVDHPGFISRLARITPSSACVERTFLANVSIGIESLVVVAGNGGVGAHVGEKGAQTPGLKCEPLDTKALPVPPKNPSAASGK